ncbi:cyclic nucleotide-binding domain-containing protein [Allorhizobium pseudoryzae]|uniref:cyclic nucleotide-binding domain-containing protein n=1 Tax=Allorhizobium pseudoryzae TaxID=379684 RepID=UPI0013E9FA6D|nr:Crp/Fnr family transcriptional regulator [Allorhizobium pseudoryzae]
MLLNDEVTLLRQVPYFSRIDPCKLKLLAFTSARVCYRPGEAIFQCGDASDSAYVIIDGTVELVVSGPSGENVVGSAARNSIIGEMCLWGDAPRRGHARAVTDVEVLRIGKDCFLKVMADNPRMGIEVSRALAETLRDRANGIGKRPVAVLEPAD